MDYLKLKGELNKLTYNNLSDIEAKQQLNDKIIPCKVNIITRDLRKYLVLVNKLIVLESSEHTTAIAVNRFLDLFDTLDITESVVEQVLIANIDALININILDETDKTNILNLGLKLISRAEELGFNELKESDINYARRI